MSDRLYSKDHEWIEMDGDIATVGISEHAQEQLGDVVFVELPDIGRSLSQNEEAGVVESVKAASELYAPVSGEVIESNDELTDDPAKVNVDAMGDGWFFKIRISAMDELENLMDKAAYDALVAGQS